MDQYTGYKELEFDSTNSDFMEWTCKKINEWKNSGKPVSYIRHDYALENKVMMKIANDLQWKLGVIATLARACHRRISLPN